MTRINVAPFSVPDEAKTFIEIVRPYAQLREFEWTSPVSLSRPIIVLDGFVGVGYLDLELDLRPTYLLVPGAVGMPLDPNDQYNGREPLLPIGARVLELDTERRWPAEVEAAFGRLVGFELRRMTDWVVWRDTRNRMERVQDVFQAVGHLNSKSLSSLTGIPLKTIRQRFRQYTRASGRVADAERELPPTGRASGEGSLF